MGISAADVKRLREATGVGMMDCKKALAEAEGDFDKAVDLLRTKGQATAAKRAGKTAAEGTVIVKVDGAKGVVLELNCETDFVARNEDFLALAGTLADQVLSNGPSDVDALAGLEVDGKAVKAMVEETTGTVGEKIVVRRFAHMDAGDGFLQDYIHGNGRIGVLVQLSGQASDEAKAEVARDVAMQVAAMRPTFLSPDDVPEDERARELEVQKARVLEEGKPENMVEKIANGRMNKYFSEVCLLKQPFVKENKKSVEKVVEEAGLKVVAFHRFEVGEGMSAEAAD